MPKYLFTLACSLPMLLASQAQACSPVRIGYTSQHAPPYYLGSGLEVPTLPGASVELLRNMAAAAGCSATFVRLPPGRIRVALADGTVDMAPLNALATDTAIAALPLDKLGQLDTRNSLEVYAVVFVRTRDSLSRLTDTARYFKGKRLGMNQGSSFIGTLREQGYAVDDGGANMERNVAKLMMGRLDGYAVALTTPSAMDNVMREQHGMGVMRLEQPLHVAHSWIAVNKRYHARNAQRVESMWQWIGASGRAELNELLKKYNAQPAPK